MQGRMEETEVFHCRRVGTRSIGMGNGRLKGFRGQDHLGKRWGVRYRQKTRGECGQNLKKKNQG